MQDHQFWGLTAGDWSALGTVAAAALALVNVAVIIILAVFNYLYLKRTDDLVKAAKEQADSAKAQADSAARTVDFLIADRNENNAYQQSMFRQSLNAIREALDRYEHLLKSEAAPGQQNCCLLPDKWDTCVAHTLHNMPGMLGKMLQLKAALNGAASTTQGFVSSPVSLWISTRAQRLKQVEEFAELRELIDELLAEEDATSRGTHR